MSDDKDLKHDKHPHPNPSPSKGEGLTRKIPLVPPEQRLQSKTFETKGEALQQKSSGAEDEEPYPGLRPYREDEKGKFFGRDTDTEILIDKVLTNRLTLLFAASGVGKSSLLQAAVIPHLKSKTGENLAVVYHIDWVSDPVRSVGDAVLAGLRSAELLPDDVGDEERGETLADLLGFCGLFVRPPLVLILDQFEEFFRYQRHQEGFRQFIDQLTAVVTNKSLPVSVVVSMREDFALELNAFKPKLPTILFENFYRLEKLGRRAVRDAIVTPVEQRGFAYEPELLDQLLTDLLSRELDRQPNSPVVEMLETVEPPYLQIVCARLWELNKDDAEQTLRLASYEKVGRAQGILKNYLDGVLQRFSFAEKQLASQAFDHLVSNRGVKMAYTAEALAETVRVDSGELGAVLKKLEGVRVLRELPRENELWFELYHDMFSGSIEDWNNAWKDRMRRRLAAKIAGGVVFGIGVIVAGWDYYVNFSNYHFRLSPKQSSEQVELWRGKPGSWDLFGVQGYVAETGVKRHQLEPDKQFHHRMIGDYDDLQMELVGNLPIEKRVKVYVDSGNIKPAIILVKTFTTPQEPQFTNRVLNNLSEIRIPEFTYLLYDIVKSTKNYSTERIILGDHKINLIPLQDFFHSEIQNTGGIKSTSDVEIKLWTSVLSKPILMRRNIKELVNFYVESKPRAEILHSFINAPSPSLSIDHLVNILENKDTNIRLAAIKTLVALKAKNSSRAILKLINDNNMEIRLEAIKALGDLKSKESVLPLLELLEKKEIKINHEVIKSLKNIYSKEVDLRIINFISNTENCNSKFFEFCKSGIHYLGEVGSDHSFLALLSLLDTIDLVLYSSVINALSMHDLPKDKEDEIKPKILNLLTVKDSEILIAAINLLGKWKIKDSAEDLLRIFEQTSWGNSEVAIAAAKSALQVDVKKSTPTLLDHLNSNYIDVKISSAKALLEFHPEKAIPVLLKVSKEETPKQSKNIIFGTNFKAVDASNTVSALENKKLLLRGILSALESEDKYIREAAVERVGHQLLSKEFNKSDLINKLASLLKDKKISVRRAAAYKLSELESDLAIPFLKNDLENPSVGISLQAAKILGNLGVESSIPVLLKHLTITPYYSTRSEIISILINTADKNTVLEIIQLLEELEDDEIKEVLIILLGEIRSYSRDIIPFLQQYYKGKSQAIKSTSIAVLGNLGDISSLPLIKKLIGNSSKSSNPSLIKALGNINSKSSIPMLLDIIRKSDGESQAAALRALGKYNSRETIPILESFLRSGDSNLRDLSKKSLVKRNLKHLIPNMFYEPTDMAYGSYTAGFSNLEEVEKLAPNEIIEPLLIRLANQEEFNKKSAIISAIRLLRDKELDKKRKTLIRKSLSQIDERFILEAKNYLLNMEKKELKESIAMFDTKINQPPTEEEPLTLKKLKKKLKEQNQAYVNWRKLRDTKEPIKENPDELATQSTEVRLKDPAPFIYEYAYAIAHESEKDGIDLLSHNLYKVREAAARGLANGDALGVPLLKKLEQKWLETDDPIARQSYFHAIDIALLAIEGIGYENELAALKTYEDELKKNNNKRSMASIHPRVEWTKIQLQWRVDANKELEELAARQFPKLLKEYCLNEDGTDIPEEECTIGN